VQSRCQGWKEVLEALRPFVEPEVIFIKFRGPQATKKTQMTEIDQILRFGSKLRPHYTRQEDRGERAMQRGFGKHIG